MAKNNIHTYLSVILIIIITTIHTKAQNVNKSINNTKDTSVCAGKTFYISSGIWVSGANFQWQGNYGSGFFNLSTNSNFQNVNEDTLTINPNSNIDGIMLRCEVVNASNDTSYSDTTVVNVTTNSYFSHTSICQGDSIYFNGQWIKNSGFYSETFEGDDGCDSIVNLHVSVTQAVDSTFERKLCEGDSILFNGKYYQEEGSYSDTVTSVLTGCDSIVTMDLSIIDMPDIEVTATPSVIFEGDSSQLYVNFDGNIIWEEDSTLSCWDCNNPIAKPEETTTYTVTIKKLYCSLSDSVTVTIAVPEIKLEIPEAFSPNEDGLNDKFIILGLEEYPDNEITIYNRWGAKVYYASPYNNKWTGINYEGASFGDKLPEGTYYYVLQLHDKENQVIKGYFYLKR